MTDPNEPKPEKPATEDETEAEQQTLKRAEDSGEDATGGTGIVTGIAQA
jgi:hypothetical protein